MDQATRERYIFMVDSDLEEGRSVEAQGEEMEGRRKETNYVNSK